MKTWQIVLLAILAVVVLPILIFVGTYISAANSANRYEKNIAAAYEDSQNVLGQLAPKLRETLGVTKIQASAVRDIITGANESRYGGEGSKAEVQWIQEQNPNLDQSSYTTILNLIEAGRNDFQAAQKRTIDERRAYDTARGNMPGSFFMRLAGYPTQAYLDKHYDRVVMSTHTANAFETGRDDGVNLNGF